MLEDSLRSPLSSIKKPSLRDVLLTGDFEAVYDISSLVISFFFSLMVRQPITPAFYESHVISRKALEMLSYWNVGADQSSEFHLAIPLFLNYLSRLHTLVLNEEKGNSGARFYLFITII